MQKIKTPDERNQEMKAESHRERKRGIMWQSEDEIKQKNRKDEASGMNRRKRFKGTLSLALAHTQASHKDSEQSTRFPQGLMSIIFFDLKCKQVKDMSRKGSLCQG